MRHRGIENRNNECGTPCSGTQLDAKPCLDPKCVNKVLDCELDAWTEWSMCDSPTAQSVRSRSIKQTPVNGGKECQGATTMTKPCESTFKKSDCEFSDWGAWTSCSATCGTGYHASMRRITKEATIGGKPCEGPLSRTSPCNESPCSKGQPCIMGAWSDWNGCDSVSPVQKYRSREVEQPSKHGGSPCNDVVKETGGCVIVGKPPVPCKLSQWSAWEKCTVTCDGGQTFRKRMMESPPENGGTCDAGEMYETKPCGTESCNPAGPGDCEMDTWSEWAACSSTCGAGISKRKRKVAKLAKYGGKGCEGPLSELKACQVSECGKKDCKWADWEDWEPCTCSCNGGTKRRTRVVAMSPLGGGKLCDTEDKSEIAPCNTQSCEKCIDGAWMSWSDWSQCSVTCDVGYRSRHRDLAVHPNSCGKPAIGFEDEYTSCASGAKCEPDLDCQLSDWAEWSTCSCTCFGIKERHRHITQYAIGSGKPCVSDATKEVSPCNPGIGENVAPDCGTPLPQPCKLAEWSPWGNCTAKCGGGQQTRIRSILTPSATDGMPCDDALSEVAPCNTEPCKQVCIDCKWADWSVWGACSHCGGQRYRHRGVAVMPNACGKMCDPGDGKQTQQCKSPCAEEKYCAWSDWSAFSKCSADCGPATKMRQRVLEQMADKPADFLFSGKDGMTCYGVQFDNGACEYTSCSNEDIPVNCELGQWSDWSGSSCTQLCERHRVVETTNANGGTPCNGAMVETKRCVHECSTPEDCRLSEWTAWSSCGDDDVQKYRSRSIVQMGSNGGKLCTGLLRETAPCGQTKVENVPESCKLSQWTKWSQCTKTCGGGVSERSRTVEQKASYGGEPCTGNLQELQCCGGGSCIGAGTPCKVGTWTDWGDCSESSQQYRERKIIEEGSNGGAPCDMPLKQVQQCAAVTDCVVSDWSAWDACDKTCGGGQQSRLRQVFTSPKNGGFPCPEDLLETQGCNKQPCSSKDCEMGGWSVWSSCPVDCGTGQQTRTRSVMQLAQDSGKGCENIVSETRECEDAKGNPIPPCATADCLWSSWSDWSSCSCSCDGGQRTRDRRIHRIPLKGGKPCEPHSSEEVQPCSTQPCGKSLCIDGKWADWHDWETCSATCDGGTTWRVRSVEQEANVCGNPVQGLSQQMASCNSNIPCYTSVDCEFGDWQDWGACTQGCGGLKSRGRQIKTMGRGDGKFCMGDVKQTHPCNPGEGEAPPAGCEIAETPEPCILSAWEDWESCSVSCGGGQTRRSRSIKQPPSHGGASCDQALAEIGGCGTGPCTSDCVPKDCVWSDWESWSVCNKCGGEKTRVRHVQVHPNSCGKPCDPAFAEEATECPRECHQPTYCAMSEWKDWSQCSAKCGSGVRSRSRELHLTVVEPEMRFLEEAYSLDEKTLESKFQVLEERASSLEVRRLQRIATSFACGLLSLVAGLALQRVFSRRRRAAGLMRDLTPTVTVEIE